MSVDTHVISVYEQNTSAKLNVALGSGSLYGPRGEKFIFGWS